MDQNKSEIETGLFAWLFSPAYIFSLVISIGGVCAYFNLQKTFLSWLSPFILIFSLAVAFVIDGTKRCASKDDFYASLVFIILAFLLAIFLRPHSGYIVYPFMFLGAGIGCMINAWRKNRAIKRG